MAFAIYPRYSDIYEDKVPTVESLIRGIPTQAIVRLVCYINARKYSKPDDIDVDRGIFFQLIARVEDSKRGSIGKRLSNFAAPHIIANRSLTIFATTIMLRLLETALVNHSDVADRELTAEEEEKFLKAVLVLNQSDEQNYLNRVKRSKSKPGLDTYIAWLWPNLLPTIEFQFRKEVFVPIFFSLEFFTALERDQRFKRYLEQYYKLNNVSSHQEFLKKLLDFNINGFNKGRNWMHHELDRNILNYNSVIAKYIFDVNSDNIQVLRRLGASGFKQFRKTPFIRFTDGSIYITNWSFFLDKYFQAQKFDLYHSTDLQELYFDKEPNKRFQAYNGEIGDLIEHAIFRKTIDRFFKQDQLVMIDQDKAKGWNQDLYCRLSKHVTFLEFKSTIFPLKTTFQEIKAVVDDETKVLKGVFQLVDQIKKYKENVNRFGDMSSTSFAEEDIIYYPAIIYTDISWSLYGVTDYYNQIFRQELQKQKISGNRIQNIVMIHIDFFYKHEKIFTERKVPLHMLLWKHNMQKSLCIDIYSRNPGIEQANTIFADSYYYLGRAFPGSYTDASNSLLFRICLEAMGVKKES